MSSSKRARLRRRQDRAKHLRIVGIDEQPPQPPAPEISHDPDVLRQGIADLREQFDHIAAPFRSPRLPTVRPEEGVPTTRRAPRERPEWADSMWFVMGVVSLMVALAFLAAATVATGLWDKPWLKFPYDY